MAICIYTGVCSGGPWDGQIYRHTFTRGIRGVINVLAPGGIRGSYEFKFGLSHGIWTWGDWREG